jgi:hypothetical protein
MIAELECLWRQRNLMQQIQKTCVQRIESGYSQEKAVTISVIGNAEIK